GPLYLLERRCRREGVWWAAELDGDGVYGARRYFHDGTVLVGASVAVVAPERAESGEHREVDVGHDDVVGGGAGLGHDLALRVYDHAVAVVIARGSSDIHADLVDAAHVVGVGDGVGAKLDVPQVAGHPRGGGGHEHDLGAAKAEHTRRLREVAVVAD